MERTTEHTRTGGTHYVNPRKGKKRDHEPNPETEEQRDAHEADRNRGEG